MSLVRGVSFNKYNETSNSRHVAREITYLYKGEEIPIVYGPFKLHIYFHLTQLTRVERDIRELLDDATEKLTLTGYKVLFWKDIPFIEPIKLRNNIVYTLYLHENSNPDLNKKIAELCEKIKKILQAADVSKIGSLAQQLNSETSSEVFLSDYFTLRATNTEDNIQRSIYKYYDIQSSIQILKALRKTALNCEYYKFLKTDMTITYDAKTVTAPALSVLSKHVAAGNSPIGKKLADPDANSLVYSCAMTRGRSRLVY